MLRSRLVVSSLILVPLLLLSCLSPSDAQSVVRGLVVDRTDQALWLGFPTPVQQGDVFNVMLSPGAKVIAQARVIEATPDAPYIARASYAILELGDFVPVGAYVEATDQIVDDRDRPVDGYRDLRLDGPDSRRLSFNAGVFFPLDETLEDETSSAWPALELRYRTNSSSAVDFGIVLGFYGADGDFTTQVGEVTASGSRDINVVPISLDARFRPSGDRYRGWFGRVGIGAYIINDDRTVAGVSDDTTLTTFGWQAGIGYESRSGRSAQLYYVDVARTDFEGVVFSVGARF